MKLEQVRFEETRDATALLLSCTLAEEPFPPPTYPSDVYCVFREFQKNLADFAQFWPPPRVDLMPGCLSMGERIFYYLWNAWTRSFEDAAMLLQVP